MLIKFSTCDVFIYFFFMRLFMMSFKYALILLRYSSANSVSFLSPLLSYAIYLLLQKITYSCWFIIIYLFFFSMLKKIFNISKYSLYLYILFIFFYKRFLMSLILNFSSLYVVKKINEKNKIQLYSFKSIVRYYL